MTVEAFGQNLANTANTLVTTGADDTKGAFAEMAASTGIDSKWIEIIFFSGAANESWLFDIAIGAASSEVVVVANIPYLSGGPSNLAISARVLLPLTIASGTRISVRGQCTANALLCNVSIHISDSEIAGTSPSNITLGANTGTSLGTTIDPGSTAHTKGSYVELSSSTSADIDMICMIVHGVDNTVARLNRWLIDIAIGAASSEVVVVPNVYLGSNANEDFTPDVFLIPAEIASGSRVAVRCQTLDTDATDRLIDVVLIGCKMDAIAAGGGAPKQAGRGGGMAG